MLVATVCKYYRSMISGYLIYRYRRNILRPTVLCHTHHPKQGATRILAVLFVSRMPVLMTLMKHRKEQLT